ncbi:unnamed protein product [Caenorhabditis sp. 36 PRJEB53466]|nr:unnamed protein product [Caenorhabditis sp. 36 PRJEB53466]
MEPIGEDDFNAYDSFRLQVLRYRQEQEGAAFEGEGEVPRHKRHQTESKHHFLVLSKQHIAKPTDLTAADIPLLEEMERTGRELLREKLKKEGEADTVEDMLRIGFHFTPLLSVHHLHMHVIYPISDMGLISRKITFRPGKVFKSTRELVDQLKEAAGVPDPLEGNPAKDDCHDGIPAHAIA